MKRVQEIIKEAQEFGVCYVGSFDWDFALSTNALIEKIERYARENRIETEYRNIEENCTVNCYLIIRG
jgi:hypothetical protein